MASRFDGTGVVKLQTSEGAYTSLKLAQLPWPEEMGEVVNGRRQFVRPKQGIGTDEGNAIQLLMVEKALKRRFGDDEDESAKDDDYEFFSRYA